MSGMACVWGDGCDQAVIAHGLCRDHHEDYRRKAALFNDIGNANLPSKQQGHHLRFSDRLALREYLWSQGWRREVRPEDVNDPRPVTTAPAPAAVGSESERGSQG